MGDVIQPQSKLRNVNWSYILVGVSLAAAGVLAVKTDKADAACAWGIRAGAEGEYGAGYLTYAACGNGVSKDGSFKAETTTGENSDMIQKITLTNYHGGTIYLEGCGSSSVYPQKAIIELIGENTLIAEGGLGIDLSMPVEFTGEGSLEITAMIPIGGGYLCGVCGEYNGIECKANPGNQLSEDQSKELKFSLGTHTLIIKPTIIEKEVAVPTEPTPPENTNPNEPADEENKCPDKTIIESDSGEWNVWDVVMLAYIGISVVVFAGLAVHWGLKRRKAKTGTNWKNQQGITDTEAQQSEDSSKPDVL